MKSFKQKQQELKKLNDNLAKSKLAVITSFARAGEKGLNVSEMSALKKELRLMDSEYAVEKRTLLERAMPSDLRPDLPQFQGSLGIVFGYGDEVATAKTVYTFAKKNPALKFFGAVFGSKFLDQDKFSQLAKLPSREVLIGRVLGMMKYPISGLVNVLQGNIKSLALILNQIAINKQKAK